MELIPRIASFHVQLGLRHVRKIFGDLAVRVPPVFPADVFRECVEEDVDLREVQR